MAPTTKEAQRAELHKTMWRLANGLCGSVDGWDFKAYVLGMLFYRFISENLTASLNKREREAGNSGFDYVTCSDEEAEFGPWDTVEEKGFYILPPELFENVRMKAAQDPDLNETLEAIGDLPLGNFEDNLIDLFGDTYEYLMQMYASKAGKSGGEYSTAQEVSEVLARIAVADKRRVNRVYEPFLPRRIQTCANLVLAA